MLKGFTLLEMLFVILIISLLLALSLPNWQQTNAQFILAKEQQKLYLFLKQIQSRVENSTDIWFLIANRNMEKQTWCLTAQIKGDTLCDCLNPRFCPTEANPYFYYPAFFGQTMLISKQYYPKEITRLSGIRNTATSNCFVLQAGNSRTVFSFFNVGSLKLKDYQSLSACVKG